MDVRRRLGELARTLRVTQNLTQAEVEQRTQISRDVISMFESRGERLGMDKIEQLFQCYGYQLTAVRSDQVITQQARDVVENFVQMLLNLTKKGNL